MDTKASTAPTPLPQIASRTYIHPKSLTILATYKCTAACENCCFGSNPSLTKRIGLEDILQFIEEAAVHPSLEVVAFSGGECFLLGDDLVKAVAFAHSKGLLTRVVTNGYWAKSMETGRRKLQALKDAGLSELNVSTGDYHQEWVPHETVVNAVQLGVELELDHTLMVVEMQKTRRVSFNTIKEDPRIQALLAATDKAKFNIVESPWMPMDESEVIEQEGLTMLNSDSLHVKEGCHSIFTTVVVNPEREIGICCGLSREMIPELNMDWGGKAVADLLEESCNDFMKIWLFVDGPEKILAWAASKNPNIDWENRYAHMCHACLAIYKSPEVRRTIAQHYRERVDDVLFRYNIKLRKQEALDGIMYG